MDKGIFEATVDFDPKNIKLPAKLLGTTMSFEFKKRRYTICFPDVDYVAEGDVFKSTTRGTKIRLKWIGENQRWHPHDYASVGRRKGDIASDFSASCFVVQSFTAVTRTQALKCKQDLMLWRDIVPLWIEAFTLINLESKDFYLDQQKRLDAYYIPVKKGKIHNVKIKDEFNSVIHVSSSKPVQVSDFRKALKAASSGHVPPGYYVMLQQGLRALDSHSYRQAIFEISSATELAMAELLDRRLRVLNSKRKKHILKNVKQLAGLAQALEITGELISPDIQTKIGNPRNKAIHNGSEVTREQARAAYDTAVRFVKLKLPL